MSLPPQIVRIKRKASEAPVDFLRVHEANGKRQRRATDFVFSLQQSPETVNDSKPSPAPQDGRRIKAIHRTPISQASSANVAPADAESDSLSKRPEIPATHVRNATVPLTHSQQDVMQQSLATPQKAVQPRRFHISRGATTSTSESSPVGGLRRKRGARDEPVFVERRVRLRTSDELAGQAVPIPPSSTPPSSDQSIQARVLKKPGLAKRSAAIKSSPSIQPSQSSSAPAPARQLQIPSGYADSDEFLAQMQAYTLQEIGHSIAESQAFGSKTTTPVTTARKPQKSKFTPKKPALRYHERHPEQASKLNAASAVDIDQAYEDQEDTDDDAEYIIDTYIRIPAEAMGTEDAPKDFGLLVLDSQPDIDEFYREHDDSDEEEEDEEEDENAENHYSADYPDEEVDSDDEYDRNAYNYRNHNASDLEEFDEDDATFSDEDNDDTKYPWLKKPWLTKRLTVDEMVDKDD